jgi:AraC-like DNA-binding protein
VLRLRVNHAQRLLLSTTRTISSVALESGFGSSGRLYAAFAKLVGQTPSAYRKSGSFSTHRANPVVQRDRAFADGSDVDGSDVGGTWWAGRE